MQKIQNHKISTVVLLSLLGSLPAVASQAAQTIKEPSYWGIQIENDLFGSGDDQFYTNGLQINYMKRHTSPLWLEKWVTRLPFFVVGSQKGGGYSFGQKMFTPQNVDSKALVKDDRPYAGWLYLSTSVASLIKDEVNKREMNAFELTVGVVGPSSKAGDVQNEFHQLIGSSLSNGWDNQLKDELGVFATYVRKTEYFTYLKNGLEYAWSPHRVMALGNVYTYAGAGLMFRIGQNLKNDIGPPNISPGFPGASFFSANKEGKGWYIFAGAEGRGVFRNIFLDGNSFQESHRVEKNPWVLDFQYGIAYQHKNVRVAFSNVLRSKEFEGQGDNAAFGAINISFFLD